MIALHHGYVVVHFFSKDDYVKVLTQGFNSHHLVTEFLPCCSQNFVDLCLGMFLRNAN